MGPIRRTALACALAAALAVFLAAIAYAEAGISIGREAVNETMTSSSVSFTAGGTTLRCPLTLSGTIDEATKKVTERLIGEITAVRLGSCSGGELRVLTETLPWYSRYVSFQGTLPTITGVTVDLKEVATLASVTVLGFPVRCLYRGLGRGIVNGPEATQLRFEERTAIPLSATLSGVCPETATMSGTLSLSPTFRLTLLAAAGGGITYTPPTFPVTPRRTSSIRSLTIENSSQYPLRVASIDIIGSGAGAFSVVPEGFVVRGNRSTGLPITFTPPEVQSYAATVRFLNLTGGVIASIEISGSGS